MIYEIFKDNILNFSISKKKKKKKKKKSILFEEKHKIPVSSNWKILEDHEIRHKY